MLPPVLASNQANSAHSYAWYTFLFSFSLNFLSSSFINIFAIFVWWWVAETLLVQLEMNKNYNKKN